VIRLLLLLVDDLDPDAAERGRIKDAIEAMAPGRVTVSVEPIRFGVSHYYESATGLAMAVPGILDQVDRHQDDTDAIVLGCFGDPGLHAAREFSRVPVIGAGEASMVLAQLYARRFGIVHIRETNMPECEAELATLGLSGKCAGMGAIDLAFYELQDDEPKTFELLVRESRKLAERGAETIILGCMSLGLGPFSAELARTLQMPVINPVKAALAAAQVFDTVGPPASGRPQDFEHLRSYLPAVERALTAAGLTAGPAGPAAGSSPAPTSPGGSPSGGGLS
jgi:allantoin racemase